MQDRSGTPILTNLVRVHPRNINTKLEANPCSSLGKVEKGKSSGRQQTQGDRKSHTCSLSVTKNE